LLEDSLVIADLSGDNPNVFYELAIRHAVRKPVVLLTQVGQLIPFDVSQSRAIPLDYRDLDSVDRCKKELFRQIKSVESDPYKVDSPISVAVDLQNLRQSENPLDKTMANIISMLEQIRNKLDSGFPVRHSKRSLIGKQMSRQDILKAIQNSNKAILDEIASGNITFPYEDVLSEQRKVIGGEAIGGDWDDQPDISKHN
jgi:hypothetical protein